MKRKPSRLAEVQVAGAVHLTPASLWPATNPGAGFLVHLPAGVTVAVPAGFAGEEVMVLLTVVREAWR